MDPKTQIEAALAALFAAETALTAAYALLDVQEAQPPTDEPETQETGTEAPLPAPPPVGSPESNPTRDQILTMGQPAEPIIKP